jgi:hypothetical protein
MAPKEKKNKRMGERERFHSTRENLGQKAIATNTGAHPLYARHRLNIGRRMELFF